MVVQFMGCLGSAALSLLLVLLLLLLLLVLLLLLGLVRSTDRGSALSLLGSFILIHNFHLFNHHSFSDSDRSGLVLLLQSFHGFVLFTQVTLLPVLGSGFR